MTAAQAPPGKEQAPGLASEGSSKNNTDSHIVSDDGGSTWDVALYEFGAGTGYGIGWAHGWAACEGEWQALLGVYRRTLRLPRHADLETARQPTDGPCPTRCRSCARCARCTAVHRNRERYGTADYPGGGRWTP